jgi:hypothetical protein
MACHSFGGEVEVSNTPTIRRLIPHAVTNFRAYLRIFTSYPDILDHCCEAWNKLTDRPWLNMSIGLRDWAHRL